MNIPHFYVSSARVTTRLPSILLDAIQKHGKGISLLLSLFPPPIFSYLLSSQMLSSSHLLIVEDSSVVVQKNSFSKPGKLLSCVLCLSRPSFLLSPSAPLYDLLFPPLNSNILQRWSLHWRAHLKGEEMEKEVMLSSKLHGACVLIRMTNVYISAIQATTPFES